MHTSTRTTPARRPSRPGLSLLAPTRLQSCSGLSLLTPAVLLAALLLLLCAAPALAGAPAAVTVRVLGPAPNYEALTPPVLVTTTTALVTKNGGSCSGTSAAGALELATKGDWEGPWSTKYSDYEVTAIDGLSFPFEEGASANYYWSFWRNNLFADQSVICEAELENNDQVLFVPSCYGTGCPPPPSGLLGLQAPASSEVDEPTVVTVERYNEKGEASPLAGATVSGGGTSAETDAEGHATLTFTGDGSYTLRAVGPAEEQPRSIPGEALTCAHERRRRHPRHDRARRRRARAAADRRLPAERSEDRPLRAGRQCERHSRRACLLRDASAARTGRKGPRAERGDLHLAATAPQLPRTLLGLRRLARAPAASALRAGRLLPAMPPAGDSFSYLLPARLPAGRYVLDIRATDSAGNRTVLARGSTRTVFYVK